MSSTHVARRIAGWLFAGLTGLYLLLGSGHIDSPDGVVMFRVSQSLLDRGAVDVEPLANWPGFGGSPAPPAASGEPRLYAKYGLGQSLVGLPTLLLGRVLADLARDSERGLFDTPIGMDPSPDPEQPFARGNPFRIRWDDWSAGAWPRPFEAWAASWTNAWVVAATAALLFLLGCELGFGVRASLGMALLAALATPLTVYSTTFFAEPLAALALVAFLLLLVRAVRRERGTALLFAAGLALGACVLAKIAHAVLLPPAGLLVLALLRRRARLFDEARTRAAWTRSLASFGSGLALPLLAIALYDLARFGTVFETGYASEAAQWTTPFLEGLAGLLASPGRGLFWFAPIVVASLAVAPRFARRFPLEGAFALAVGVALLATYARWYMWEGGWCWGPRFLVPLLPLAMLPIGALLAERPRRLAVHGSLAVLALLSLVVAVDGLIVNPIDFHNWVKLTHGFRAQEFAAVGAGSYYDLIRWDWRFSPLVAHWSFPVKDGFLLPYALRTPGLVMALHGAFAVLLTVSASRIAALLAAAPVERFSGSEAFAAPETR